MKLIQTIIVNELEQDTRLYDYCLNKFDALPSRKSVKKAIDRREVWVNGEAQKTGYWLRGAEKIELFDLENRAPKPYHLDLQVIYEDEHLIIVNKPAGLRVSGNQFKTLFNALADNFTLSTEKDALGWPLPVHRLDQPTSGLIISAKTTSARIKLGQQFEAREIKKTYHALVMGKSPQTFESTTPIDKKEAFTSFETLQIGRSLHCDYLSLLKIKPKTGRKHQIRVHLAQLALPILGDKLYGPEKNTLLHKGLFLCATGLEFEHPITKNALKIEIDLPKKYYKRLESDNKRWKNAENQGI